MNNNTHTKPIDDRTIHHLSKALLDDLFNPSISTLDLCNYHDLTLPALATILESESFAIARDCIERINSARMSIVAPESHTRAMTRLADQLVIVQNPQSTPRRSAKSHRPCSTALVPPPHLAGEVSRPRMTEGVLRLLLFQRDQPQNQNRPANTRRHQPKLSTKI